MVMRIINGLFLCLQKIWSRIYDFIFVHGKKIYICLKNFKLVVVDVVCFVEVKNHCGLSRRLYAVSLFSELSQCANK